MNKLIQSFLENPYQIFIPNVLWMLNIFDYELLYLYIVLQTWYKIFILGSVNGWKLFNVVYFYDSLRVCHGRDHMVGRWFSPCPPVTSTNKTDRHDITEILLKVALNTIKQTNIKHDNLKIKKQTPTFYLIKHIYHILTTDQDFF